MTLAIRQPTHIQLKSEPNECTKERQNNGRLTCERVNEIQNGKINIKPKKRKMIFWRVCVFLFILVDFISSTPERVSEGNKETERQRKKAREEERARETDWGGDRREERIRERKREGERDIKRKRGGARERERERKKKKKRVQKQKKN